MTVTRAVLVQVAKFHVSVIFCSKVTTNYNKYNDDIYQHDVSTIVSEGFWNNYTHNTQIQVEEYWNKREDK